MSDPADQLTDELADKIREIVALIDKYAVECEAHQLPASKVLMDSRRRWKEILADYDATAPNPAPSSWPPGSAAGS